MRDFIEAFLINENNFEKVLDLFEKFFDTDLEFSGNQRQKLFEKSLENLGENKILEELKTGKYCFN